MTAGWKGHVAAAVMGIGIVTGSVAANAADYPARPVTLVVPFAPGGSIDIVARGLGRQLADRLGKPFVIDNRGGGGTVIATSFVARSAPDGHTLLIAPSALATNATLYKKLPYDPASDFAPVALVAKLPLVLVINPSLPVRTVADLVRFAKASPGRLSFASSGAGSAPHLTAELFKSMTGTEMIHVPYKGGPPAMNDVVAGHVAMMFADPGSALPHIQSGKVWALGVSSLTPLPALRDVLPLVEVGVPGFEAVSWQLIVAPAMTPQQIVIKLNAEIKEIVATADMQRQMIQGGLLPVDSPSPGELQHFLRTEIDRWGSVVQRAGIAGSQ